MKSAVNPDTQNLRISIKDEFFYFNSPSEALDWLEDSADMVEACCDV